MQKNNRGFSYGYSLDKIKGYRNSSAEWKLNWLEEMHELTMAALSPEKLELRHKIRRGEL